MDLECKDVRYIYSCKIFMLTDKSTGLIHGDAEKVDLKNSKIV